MSLFTAFVPTWQIDANEHLNTQFYLDHFDQAEASVSSVSGAQAHGWHLRFYRELHCGSCIQLTGAALPQDALPHASAYLLRNAATGEICTTARSTHACDLPQDTETELKSAPRGLAIHAGQAPSDTTAILKQGRACITYVGLIEPNDLAVNGLISSRAIHDRISDSSAHLWAFSGIQNTTFYDCGVGRAIVELSLMRYRAIPAGQAVQMVSWFDKVEDRSFVLRHLLEPYGGGRAFAEALALTLVLDLRTRRSVAMPQTLRQKLHKSPI